VFAFNFRPCLLERCRCARCITPPATQPTGDSLTLLHAADDDRCSPLTRSFSLLSRKRENARKRAPCTRGNGRSVSRLRTRSALSDREKRAAGRARLELSRESSGIVVVVGYRSLAGRRAHGIRLRRRGRAITSDETRGEFFSTPRRGSTRGERDRWGEGRISAERNSVAGRVASATAA